MKLWLTFKTIVSITAIFIGAYIFSTMSKELNSFQPWAVLTFMLLLAVLPWFPWGKYEEPLPPPDMEPALMIIKDEKERMLVVNSLKLLAFSILALFLAWWLISAFALFTPPINKPGANIFWFLWGLYIVLLYLLKEDIPIIRGGSISAGNYKQPLRILGLIFGLSLILLSILLEL